jgi:hypothetical protein
MEPRILKTSLDRPRRRQRMKKNASLKDVRHIAIVDKKTLSLTFPDKSIFLLCCSCLEKNISLEFFGEVDEVEDFNVDDPGDE